uniref:NADH-ubiquinone oxidoreductase chain 2 n=1 Tax=Iotyrris cerithiformis TaxID=3246529 RepID=Q1A791_IOTCE|nr:NADH dehydrogenase subunit 2 [Lophiotoma cerithiformis]ABB72499.1 NADH dehydrogenase subunit 2 [Lophiotoma cerithiformis]
MFSSLPFGYMFLFVMSVGSLLSISSIHWLSIWAGLEINLIGFLPLLIYQKNISESESAVKYFVIQALGSSLLIFGSLMAFNLSFTWDLYSSYYFSTFGFVILSIGLCIKLGVFPFHYWLPGVMAGLSWFSCLLLATWQKLAPLFLLLCFLELNKSYEMIYMFCLVSAGSSLMGGFGGMNQTQIRALLAYSSIGHLGWMVFAISHSEWTMKMYFLIYIVISLSMFMSLWLNNSSPMKNISNLKTSNMMQGSIMLLLLSLGGLPPLLGFISKLLVIIIGSKGPWLLIIFVLILGSLMSLFYYLSLFFSFFLNTTKSYGLSNMSVNGTIIVMINVFNIIGGVIILMTNLMNSIYAMTIFY